jgi:hypothetical protein
VHTAAKEKSGCLLLLLAVMMLLVIALATGCKPGQDNTIRRAIALPELYWEKNSRCRAEQRETGQDCEAEEAPAVAGPGN